MKTEYVSLDTVTQTDFIDRARNVYAHLTDEISREIFRARALFALTGDTGAMTGLSAEYRNLNSDMEVYAGKIRKGSHCLIWGTGVGAHYLLGRFKYFGVFVDAFVDSNPDVGSVDAKTGIPIVQKADLAANRTLYEDKTFVISYSNRAIAGEVKEWLSNELGIQDSKIAMGLFDWRNNTSQYFDFFEPKEGEILVDCGCFDGGSCFRFAGWCGQKGYEHIYSFEADPSNYEKCKNVLEPLGKCELFPYGTAGRHENVYFVAKGFEDSRIISKEEAEKLDYKGVTTVETVALDEILAGKRITFLKMDVEGADYDALLGAENLIRSNHPRMALSVYHKPEDFVTIPDLILKMNPDYKIYLRHYGLDDLETILYVE